MAFYNKKGRRVLLRKKSMASALGLTTSAPVNSIVRKAVRKAGNSAFAKKVISVVNRKYETKYVAENIVNPSTAILAGQITPANFQRILPRQVQGNGENQRIGNTTQPTRARTYWTVFPADTTLNLYDITVNIVVVRVKGASTDTAVAGTPGGDFLKVGDGTNIDPNDPNQESMLGLLNRYPVNTDRYTVLKHFKHRFCKGPNNINGAVGLANAPPTAGTPLPCKVFSFSWKPPTLLYDNAAATLPTNHYPVYLLWATANDGSAYVGNVKYLVRSEMFYKDG